ncbi:hypothetical protein E2C01_068591 [Portunus trituberculatus]|uniref:Uncharacterized protein n=1 Tax=Portunus trituberculatus TaxID=210409 RepID=A0A5B7HZV7_PORTR|nr:hypothetical protein [Portunus trituberculatus]
MPKRLTLWHPDRSGPLPASQDRLSLHTSDRLTPSLGTGSGCQAVARSGPALPGPGRPVPACPALH